ncbi:hypothetical protein TanjilG_13979 [Lupinus angustifolius]|uniref:SWIM-type domain-containing protein n=1 Tax=Lupinus angustifolius TaxID=3871 RepID=A0A1J7HQV7_LUPAN|nr:hypothetical protein TanjilG_13979 [Lupinus angustifolius]
MPRMDDILNLPVQDPPCPEFCAAHINWSKLEGGRQGGDDIALVPYARVDDFVKRESSNPECPASFCVESRRKRPEASIAKPRVDGYLEYTLYWCSYGPEDYRESDSCTEDGTSTKPAFGKGSRPGRRHMMRGCLCHFTITQVQSLQQMLRYGNGNFISFHSTFGFKKLKYPVCSLLVFDSSQNAIPAAWIITSSFVGIDIHKWIGLLSERIRTKDPRWRTRAVLLDDPSFDYSIVREAFQCRVLLCAWHVRRAWIKKIFKKCCNFEVQREMFRHLGWVLYCTRCGPNAMDTVEEFMQIFVDQCTFMDYFKSRWLASIDLWTNGIKILPVSTPEPYAAIESYHLKLKSMLLKKNCANFWSRVDWLIHTLSTKLHSAYWLEQYSLETGYFENLRDSSLSTNAWHNVLHIPDADVILDEQNLHIAKVLSQTDRSFVYTVWNPGSEFLLCDCSWSRLGNLCKHVIKVANFCRSRQVARPLMSAKVYKQALLTLLHNPPDDPLVLDHTILHVTHLQQDIKALEDLSNIGLLQPLAPDLSSQMAENPLFFQRPH